jgi:hypothetical protein
MSRFHEENAAELAICPVVNFSNLEVWCAGANGWGGDWDALGGPIPR